MIDVPATFDDFPKPVQLTSGNYDEGEIRWSNDGARIYFLTTHVDEPYYETPSTEIYSIPSAGGTAEKLTTIPMGIGDFTLSPDGRRVAFLGAITPVSYTHLDVYKRQLPSSRSKGRRYSATRSRPRTSSSSKATACP